MDIIGVFIPPERHVWQKGIHGYDKPEEYWDFTQHHIKDGEQEYDFSIYSLVKLWKLAEDGNPNILDFMLGPKDCEIYCNEFGRSIKDFAPNFLSKKSFPKYFGFAYSHLTSMQNRNKSGEYPGKRKILYERYGYDTKDLAHCMRAILALEDMLVDGKYDVRKHAEFIKSVRTGKFTFDEGLAWVKEKEEELRSLKDKSSLIEEPDHSLCANQLLWMLLNFYEGKGLN